ncbi:MAG: helix-turn-helix transcriptional regulator, partial [Actinomycetes bacterium]
SRTFSREMGLTIPQYLRQIRMERAAELLKSGKCNVTEAALEVGYNSLSHFSHAFCETMGCCPGLYPLGLTRSTGMKPAASYRQDRWWAALTVLPQVHGWNLNGKSDGNPHLDLAENERLQVRFLIGFNF